MRSLVLDDGVKIGGLQGGRSRKSMLRHSCVEIGGFVRRQEFCTARCCRGGDVMGGDEGTVPSKGDRARATSGA